MSRKQRVHTVVCPFCLIDVLATVPPTHAELLDHRRTRTYIEQQLESAGHIDWHTEQMARS